jgi:chromosome segregation ATPase
VTDDIVNDLVYALTASRDQWESAIYQRTVDEIKRLRAENDELRGDLLMKVHRIGELATEIERLREELFYCRSQLLDWR